MVFVTLVRFVPGKGKEAFEELKRLANPRENVRGGYMLLTFGQYDGIFVWEAEDLRQANKRIREISESGLFMTETMLAQPPEDFVF
jgi:uncharacterized protein with GYD domain